jgi:hypothetical protein
LIGENVPPDVSYFSVHPGIERKRHFPEQELFSKSFKGLEMRRTAKQLPLTPA